MSCSWRTIASIASSNPETQSRMNEVRLLSESRSRVTTKSSSSSSTSRMRTARVSRSDTIGWELDDLDPVTADVAHDVDQALEADRFGDEGVGAEVIGPVDVLFGFRCGEHDDRDATQIGIGFDLPQCLPPVLPRHVEVEQDPPGWGCGAVIGVAAAPVEIVEQLVSVFHEAEVVDDA